MKEIEQAKNMARDKKYRYEKLELRNQLKGFKRILRRFTFTTVHTMRYRTVAESFSWIETAV